jgi:hypothetical protein
VPETVLEQSQADEQCERFKRTVHGHHSPSWIWQVLDEPLEVKGDEPSSWIQRARSASSFEPIPSSSSRTMFWIFEHLQLEKQRTKGSTDFMLDRWLFCVSHDMERRRQQRASIVNIRYNEMSKKGLTQCQYSPRTVLPRARYPAVGSSPSSTS